MGQFYFSSAKKIVVQNRERQQSRKLKYKVQTKDWSQSMLDFIFGIPVVEARKPWLGMRRPSSDKYTTPHDFYSVLSEELIDNTYDGVATLKRRTKTAASSNAVSLLPSSGDRPHLSPMKQRRKDKAFKMKGRCVARQKHSTFVCFVFYDHLTGRERFIFHWSTSRSCFELHMDELHCVWGVLVTFNYNLCRDILPVLAYKALFYLAFFFKIMFNADMWSRKTFCQLAKTSVSIDDLAGKVDSSTSNDCKCDGS